MDGFGNRKGKPATGVHDEIYVKALAISDGTDTAVIVGADMLIIPENVVDAVRTRVSQETSLTSNEILFSASHNHSGPGALAPGLASRLFSGQFDPEIPAFLTTSFTEAIVEAYQSLEGAQLAHGGVDAPEYIRNRTRDESPVDSELSYLLLEQEDGDLCFVVSYSAHPTILGSRNMEFTGEYPGFLMRRITEETGAETIYLGGAVGGMAHRAPEEDDDFERSRLMGVVLANKVLESALPKPQFKDRVDIASIGVPIQLPPFQLRRSGHWRVSKFLLPMLGVATDGWTHAERLGDLALVGTPADYSGEISSSSTRSGKEQKTGQVLFRAL